MLLLLLHLQLVLLLNLLCDRLELLFGVEPLLLDTFLNLLLYLLDLHEFGCVQLLHELEDNIELIEIPLLLRLIVVKLEEVFVEKRPDDRALLVLRQVVAVVLHLLLTDTFPVLDSVLPLDPLSLRIKHLKSLQLALNVVLEDVGLQSPVKVFSRLMENDLVVGLRDQRSRISFAGVVLFDLDEVLVLKRLLTWVLKVDGDVARELTVSTIMDFKRSLCHSDKGLWESLVNLELDLLYQETQVLLLSFRVCAVLEASNVATPLVSQRNVVVDVDVLPQLLTNRAYHYRYGNTGVLDSLYDDLFVYLLGLASIPVCIDFHN